MTVIPLLLFFMIDVKLIVQYLLHNEGFAVRSTFCALTFLCISGPKDEATNQWMLSITSEFSCEKENRT